MFLAIFLHEITLYAIDIHKNRFITPFLTLKTHFQKRPSIGLNFLEHLRLGHIRVCVCICILRNVFVVRWSFSALQDISYLPISSFVSSTSIKPFVSTASIKKYIVLCNQGFTYLWKSQMCPSKKTNITNRYNRKHQK